MGLAQRPGFQAAGLFVVVLPLYWLTSYGAVRSPDAEVIFRVAESIARAGRFDLQPLGLWPEHGVSPGPDGKLYGVYGPVHSLLLAPVIAWAVRRAPDAPEAAPISHYVEPGIFAILEGDTHSKLPGHRLRHVVSFLNGVIGALGVVVFFWVSLLLSHSGRAAVVASGVFALGSLHWSYSGTFFSEQPTVLLLLLGLVPLLRLDPRLEVAPVTSPLGESALLAASGWLLALAAATHATALTLLPFLGLYAALVVVRRRAHWTGAAAPLACFAIGAGVVFAGWAAFNHVRFGSLLETGRTVNAEQAKIYVHGGAIPIWYGLHGLLVSSGKGVLTHCPAVFLGLVGWAALHARHRELAWLLGAAVVARLLFFSSLGIWHGGYSLGPRYLVMALPFLLLPLAPWLAQRFERREWRAYAGFAVFAVACVIQQWYLALGEIFTYLHRLRFSQGVEVILSEQAYRSWDLSPLLRLHQDLRGPYLLTDIPLSNLGLFGVGAAGLALAGGLAFWALWALWPGAAEVRG